MKDPEKQAEIANIKKECEKYNIVFDPQKLVFIEADTNNPVNLNSYRLVVIKENNTLKIDKFFSEEQVSKWLMLSIGEQPEGLIGDQGEQRVGCLFVEKDTTGLDSIFSYIPFSGDY